MDGAGSQPFTIKNEMLVPGLNTRFALQVVNQGSYCCRGQGYDRVSSISMVDNVDGYFSCKIVCSEPVNVGGQGENDTRRTQCSWRTSIAVNLALKGGGSYGISGSVAVGDIHHKVQTLQICRDDVPYLRSQVNHISLANGELIRLECNVTRVVAVVSFNKGFGSLETHSEEHLKPFTQTKVPHMLRA